MRVANAVAFHVRAIGTRTAGIAWRGHSHCAAAQCSTVTCTHPRRVGGAGRPQYTHVDGATASRTKPPDARARCASKHAQQNTPVVLDDAHTYRANSKSHGRPHDTHSTKSVS
jgi:hypothetical protein